MNVSVNKETFDVRMSGYGIVAGYPVLCDELSVPAKALYAYFCSFSGKENTTVFPLLGTILRDLGLSKSTYYKAKNELVGAGYISISKKYIDKFRYRNMYKIEQRPAAYVRTGRKSGMMEHYGFAPKAVMRDPLLSVKAKALYIYLSVKSCGRKVLSVPKSIIKKELGLSERLIGNSTRELVSKGYLYTSQRGTDGAFCHTVFEFLGLPESTDKKTSSCTLPYAGSSDVVNKTPAVENQEVAKWETEQNKNTTLNNNIIHSTTEDIKDNVTLNDVLSKECSYAEASKAVEKESFSFDALPVNRKMVFEEISLCHEAIVKMLVWKAPYKAKGYTVTKELFKDRLRRYLRIHSLKDLVRSCCSKFVASGEEIEYRLSYMIGTVFEAVSTCDAELCQDPFVRSMFSI